MSEAADTTGTAALDTAKAIDGCGDESVSGGGAGLHDQLSSISNYIAVIDEAVTSHCDAAVCLATWRQIVHLAPPTGMMSSHLALEKTVAACESADCDQQQGYHVRHCT